jgi:hypothetical protein
MKHDRMRPFLRRLSQKNPDLAVAAEHWWSECRAGETEQPAAVESKAATIRSRGAES